jgi:hypothetical protein
MIAILTASSGVRAEEAPVKVGATPDEVREALGTPDGYMRIGSKEVYVYERGNVTLRDGRVVEFSLVSEGEAEARRLERERLRHARARARQERRERLLAEGKAAKAEALADTALMTASGREQVTFWKQFRERYPDVSVEAEYAEALAQRERELERERLERQVRELERRVARAEQRAAEAEWRCRQPRVVYYPRTIVRYYDEPARYHHVVPARSHIRQNTCTRSVLGLGASRPNGVVFSTDSASFRLRVSP